MEMEFQDRLLQDLRKTIREDVVNFIILEMEGGKTLYFNKFVHVGITMGNFKCYVIEMRQPIDVCLKYNRGRRSRSDISDAITDLEKRPSPAKTPLLDPTSLLSPRTLRSVYVPPQITPEFRETPAPVPSNIQDLATNLAQLLQNKKVMDLLQSSLHPTPQPLMFAPIQMPPQQQQSQQPVQEPFFTEDPVFKPAKNIEYNHTHMQSFDEKMLEFKVFRVIDYKHKTTFKLREFTKDIEPEKIIEKRTAVALRKKILEHLKSAERPEDTVSNPSYPNNWEKIVVDRPKTFNMRKKRLTPKIQRIKARKEEENSSNWKTLGYNPPE
jgi:hypothetical protein